MRYTTRQITFFLVYAEHTKRKMGFVGNSFLTIPYVSGCVDRKASDTHIRSVL